MAVHDNYPDQLTAGADSQATCWWRLVVKQNNGG